MTMSLGSEASPYPTVSYWVRMLKLGNNILENPGGPPRSVDVTLNPKIFDALREFPFHSFQTLASSLKRSMFTIREHLIRAGFELKHLKWVPHALSEEHKRMRVAQAQELLRM
jgi:hypothetical protein